MKAIERILFKLVIIQLIILIVVQGMIHEFPIMNYLNKLQLYEGVAGMEEQPKMDVFNLKK